MCLAFLAVTNSRGCTEGQTLFFLEVSRTDSSDKIELTWLLVFISPVAAVHLEWWVVVMALRDHEKRTDM